MSDLFTLTWWVSVVLAGLIVNLLGAYLKSPVDRFLSNTSSAWRRRSDAKKIEFQEQVDRLISSGRIPEHQYRMLELRFNQMFLHFSSIFCFVMVEFITRVSADYRTFSMIAGVVGFLCASFALAIQIGAQGRGEVIHAALRKQAEAENKSNEVT